MHQLNDIREADKTRRQTLQWLAPGDFEEAHEGHFKKRFGNTGGWLLDDHRFTSWKDKTQSSLLWCHGARKWPLYTCLPCILTMV